MPTLIQRSFAGGELAPSLHSRCDLVKYATGLKTCRNMMIQKWGGATSRPGSIFVDISRYPDKTARLVPFSDGGENYFIEFGHKYFRVIHNGTYIFLGSSETISNITQSNPGKITLSGAHQDLDEIYIDGVGGMTELNGKRWGIVDKNDGAFTLIHPDIEHFETPKAITGISKANPGVVTAPGHGFENGDEVYIYGVKGMEEVNLLYYTVAEKTDDTFKLSGVDTTGYTSYSSGGWVSKVNQASYVDTTGFGAYTSGGSARLLSQGQQEYLFDESELREFQYSPNKGYLTVVHRQHPPFIVVRFGENSWSISLIGFDNVFVPTNVNNNGAAGSTYSWVVTAVMPDTYIESLPSSPTSTNTNPGSSPVTITWSGVTGALEYNIYRSVFGVYSYVGTSRGTSFIDNGIEAGVLDNPPEGSGFDLDSGQYPGVIESHQLRTIYASYNDNLLNVRMTRIGSSNYFPTRVLSRDDEAIIFSLTPKDDTEIRHIIGLRRLVILTDKGAWVADGNDAGLILPGQINLNQHSYNGASTLKPIVSDNNVLFVEAGGYIVRDLGYNVQIDGYHGNDLSVFASHLFEGHTIVDWAYQKKPHSIIWAVRDDGVLLGLTYIREHDIWAWHRHDTDGKVESVCAAQEGAEDAVYMVVKRTIEGVEKRYIERMTQRYFNDVVDFIGMDSALTYDGRNADTTHTMTLSGGTNWDENETITITSSKSYFSAGEVGNAIHLTGSDGTIIRFDLTAFVSDTEMQGRPHKTVPVAMRGAAISNWARAVDTVSGLDHLEGKEVSVFADGFVVASPNNSAYEVLVVEDGSITLDRPYGVIHVGLPFIADLETLDIDIPDGETFIDKSRIVNEVTMFVEKTRGVWVGASPPSDDSVNPLEGLYELKARDTENYDEPTDLDTGKINVVIRSEWNSNGRIFVRQVDPLPMTIMAIAPRGTFPFRRG